MRNVVLSLGLFLIIGISTAHAANLVDVYQEAAISDPVFQQAVNQRLSDNEAVPISFANLLPNIGVQVSPTVTKSAFSGPGSNFLGSFSQRGYTLYATATQTIFNFAQFSNLSGAKASAKQADATFNYATQSLITRVASAYFAVLQDEDNLRYAAANKKTYERQLDQVTQQYKVGLKTITDVYTARAGYDSSSASYIATETQLANDKENLRAITGNLYPSLAKLSEAFPLISPQPADIDAWVTTATKQNWSVKSSQYALEVAMQKIKQQFAGHLPTLNAEGIYNIAYTRNTGSSNPLFYPPGSNQGHIRTFELNLNVPVFAGGQVIAQTKQAQYNYQVSSQKLEQSMRSAINTTRQSYMGVIAGISKIHADKQAIISTRSSYEGLKAQYGVGTATLVDVLSLQQKLLQAYQQYSADRYAYVNNLLALKQAAGTLSPDDVYAINAWLRDGDIESKVAKDSSKKKQVAVK